MDKKVGSENGAPLLALAITDHPSVERDYLPQRILSFAIPHIGPNECLYSAMPTISRLLSHPVLFLLAFFLAAHEPTALYQRTHQIKNIHDTPRR